MIRAKLRKLDRTLRAHLKEQQQQQQVAPPKQDYLDKDCHKTYSCIHCRAHLAKHDELISKLFQGNHGRAYLFNKVVNIGCKQAVERELLTGLHAVADIFCHSCNTTLGWKYEQAFVASQKYKEGKYIIELVHLLKENDWDAGSAQCADSIAIEKLASSAPTSACRVAPEPRAGLNACARHVLSAQKKVRNQKVWPQEALPGSVELAPVCTTVARSSSSGRSPNQANQPSEQSASASPTSSASPSNQESERERISEIEPTKQTAHRARLESSDASSLGGKLVALSAAPVRGSSD